MTGYIRRPQLFSRLADAHRVLLAGAGGGFDVFAGLPLALALIGGDFGDAHFTDRTRTSELFIHPLMGIYFTFDLAGLAKRSMYLDRLANTETIFDVNLQIEAFREGVQVRERRAIPH